MKKRRLHLFESIKNCLKSDFPIITFLCFLVFISYVAILYFGLPDKNCSQEDKVLKICGNGLARFLFNREYTTDDAFQQTYPFYEIFYPNIFKGDMLTDVMKGYLAPLHWWITYATTWFVGDPILASHYVMFLQIFLSCLFLFLAIKHLAGAAPAFLGITWYLHTRYIFQRMTCGLPRGWAAVVFTCYFFLIAKGYHKAILVLFLVGSLLHPPATFMIAVAYGMYLVIKSICDNNKIHFQKILLMLILLSPVYVLVTYNVVKKPDYVGDMVTLEEAAKMPAFDRQGGRFPFVPLLPVKSELKIFALQAFYGRFHTPPKFLRGKIIPLIFILMGFVCLVGILKRKKFLPLEIVTYFVSIWIVYFLSRLLAFRLYVPDRHLQFPMAFFFILFFMVGIWRAFDDGNEDKEDKSHAWIQKATLKDSYGPFIMFIILGTFVYLTSGNGLSGDANFNWSLYKKGHAYEWLKNNTPQDSLIAGHPTSVDPVPLFAIRKVFISTEMAHPFYPKFYEEVEKRLKVVLDATYARTLKDLVNILEPYNIDYFLFERNLFYSENLGYGDPSKPNYDNPNSRENKGAGYPKPFKTYVKEISNRNWTEFAYRELPKEVDMKKYPFMPYKDKFMVVVDMKALKEYLAKNGETLNQAANEATSKDKNENKK